MVTFIRVKIQSLLSNWRNLEYKEDRELEQQAVVLLEDGLNFRSIQHNLSLAALTYYRFYKKRFVQYFINLLIFILLLMIFAEEPSSISVTSDPTLKDENSYVYQLPQKLAAAIEIVLLLLLSLDMGIEYYIERSGSERRKYWLLFHLLFACFSFIEILVNGLTPNYNLMYRKMLRPFYLVRRSTLIKKMIKGLISSVQELVTVLLMLVVTLIAFTIMALIIFAENGENDNAVTEQSAIFPSFVTAIENLLILTTTANNPTVMMPGFSQNRLYALFFIFYLLISVIFTNILISILYTHFTTFFRNSVASSLLRRRVAFRASFSCLQQLESNVSNFSVNSVSGTVSEDQSPQEGEYSNVKVHTTKIENCIRSCQIRDTRRKMNALKALKKDTNHWYTYEDFLKLLKTHLEAPKPFKPKSHIAETQIKFPLALKVQVLMINNTGVIIGQVISFVFFFFLTLSAAIFTNNTTEDVTAKMRAPILSINVTLTFICIVYSGLLVWAFGVKRFMESPNRVFDILSTVAISGFVVGAFVEAIRDDWHINFPDKLRTVAVLFKFALNMFHVKQVRVVIETLYDLFTNLIPFAAIMASAYYVFAVMGMILFQDEIGGEKFAEEFQLINLTFPRVEPPCGTYEQLQYWANNFNDFYAACVVLWDVMIVNNWNVFLDAFSRYSGTNYAKVYFIFWWLISNVILFNTLTALTIDSMLFRLKLSQKEHTEDTRQQELRRHSVIPPEMINQLSPVAQRMYADYARTNKYETLYDLYRESGELEEPTLEEVNAQLRAHKGKDFQCLEQPPPPPEDHGRPRLPTSNFYLTLPGQASVSTSTSEFL